MLQNCWSIEYSWANFTANTWPCSCFWTLKFYAVAIHFSALKWSSLPCILWKLAVKFKLERRSIWYSNRFRGLKTLLGALTSHIVEPKLASWFHYPSHFLRYIPGKQQVMTQMLKSLHPTRDLSWVSFSWLWPSSTPTVGRYLTNEPMSGRALCVSLLLILTNN